MSRRSQLEMANFVCKFGSDLNLVDLLDEIVVPAFTDGSLVRSYGDTQYFFLQPKVVELEGDGLAAITGRFVKSTVLKREQFFDPDKGLVHGEAELPSAPAALFALILGGHRLLFLPETAHPPSLKNFESTAKSFLKHAHARYIDARYQSDKAAFAAGRDGHRPTKKALREQFPSPEVRVIPIAGKDELRGFIDRYEIIRSAEIRLFDTNDELDNEDLIRKVRESKQAVQAKTTTLSHSSKEGLEKDGLYDQLDAAARQGSSRIRLKGRDLGGGELVGDNHEFRIRVPIDEPSEVVRDAAQAMYGAYERELAQENIPRPVVSEAARTRIQALLDKLRGSRS